MQGNIKMKKFKVFRSPGDVERNVSKHELIAVEYGKDIYDVTKRINRAVNEDAVGLPKYESGYTSSTDGPMEMVGYQSIQHYQYFIVVCLTPKVGKQYKLLEYGIIMEDTNEIVGFDPL